MAPRLKAIISYEYEPDPDTYDYPMDAEAMAAVDQAQLELDPELVLTKENLEFRVEVVAE